MSISILDREGHDFSEVREILDTWRAHYTLMHSV